MDEFFVGYFPAPPGIRRFVTCAVIGLAAMAVGIALVLVLAQSPFVASRFEFQRYGVYEGWMSALPYPALSTGWLLVGPGKHGFAGGSSAYVKLEGERIQNGRDRMLEILPGSVRAVAGVAPREEERDLGVVEWMGEIVDTKCYFGVMNPGRGKVHRDCAARCIARAEYLRGCWCATRRARVARCCCRVRTGGRFAPRCFDMWRNRSRRGDGCGEPGEVF